MLHKDEDFEAVVLEVEDGFSRRGREYLKVVYLTKSGKREPSFLMLFGYTWQHNRMDHLGLINRGEVMEDSFVRLMVEQTKVVIRKRVLGGKYLRIDLEDIVQQGV